MIIIHSHGNSRKLRNPITGRYIEVFELCMAGINTNGTGDFHVVFLPVEQGSRYPIGKRIEDVIIERTRYGTRLITVKEHRSVEGNKILETINWNE
jgi:hypothetical protein